MNQKYSPLLDIARTSDGRIWSIDVFCIPIYSCIGSHRKFLWFRWETKK